jgi:methylenetetrahydrofolate reductase (NADPH)
VALEPAALAALARLVAAPKFELIPLKNVGEQMAFLPGGASVTVTASPAKGIEATIELATTLQVAGFRAIPHLSARMIRDRAHLRELLARMRAAGITSAFVVGGDADQPGEFLDGLALLRAMAEADHGLREIGVPGYPQGHPDIPEPRLLQALADKAPYAHYVTTQLCFDARAIAAWIAARRASGFTLPVHLGLPGVAELHKLMLISARIGVADSRRFLAKNTRLVGRLVRPGGYSPSGLLRELAPLMADPAVGIEGLHVYTFNQVETTEAWRQRFLASLGAATMVGPKPA